MGDKVVGCRVGFDVVGWFVGSNVGCGVGGWTVGFGVGLRVVGWGVGLRVGADVGVTIRGTWAVEQSFPLEDGTFPVPAKKT